ncbi:MAG: hypothetical protein ACI9JE_001857 [Candidatus Krumholzibacteriia bacterium]|jgi:hypothetical protein
MRTGMTQIDTFLNELDGEIALNHLRALGVQGELIKDNCGGMRPHLDLVHGIRLLVPDADETKARDILAADTDKTQIPAWTCPTCQEDIESGYDACWQCGHQQS